MFEVIKAKKTWRVTHANIVDTKDSEGANLKGKVLIEKSDILGRSFVKYGRYIPFESDSFRNALTLSRQ